MITPIKKDKDVCMIKNTDVFFYLNLQVKTYQLILSKELNTTYKLFDYPSLEGGSIMNTSKMMAT